MVMQVRYPFLEGRLARVLGPVCLLLVGKGLLPEMFWSVVVTVPVTLEGMLSSLVVLQPAARRVLCRL
jgi:hypothetical protein